LKNIHQYYFVFGGVIVKPLCEIVLEQLRSLNDPAWQRKYQDLYDLETRLSLGNIAKADFFQKAASLSAFELKADELEAMVFKKAEPIPGIMDILNELHGKNVLFLFSQYPPEIYAPLGSRFGLELLIPRKNVSFASEMSLQNMTTAIIEKLCLEQGLIPGRSLWVDSDSHRTSAAIREGVDAIIYVDSRRLRREIALRGLLPLLGDE
jgi:FMN phosphatase YigB (HAD superfamily)